MVRAILVGAFLLAVVLLSLGGPNWAKTLMNQISLVSGLLMVLGFVLYTVYERLRERNRRNNPSFDHGQGNPHLTSAIDLLWKQDWPGLSALYRKQSPSDRYLLVDALGKSAVVDTPLPSDSADSAALTICCGLRVVQAWRFRGGGRGSSVSETDARRMFECLMDAQRLGMSALAINPYDSTAIACLIRAEMGLGGDREALSDLLYRAKNSFEANLFVAANHLQFLAPKWHGSIDEMWQVANKWANSGPNAAWLAIRARAHIEEWLYCVHFNGSASSAAYTAKMQDSAFLDHLRKLDDMFWEKVKASPVAGAEASFAHNNFAFLLHTPGVHDRVTPHLQRMGRYISDLPWGYLPTGADQPMHLLALLRRKYKLERLGREEHRTLATTPGA